MSTFLALLALGLAPAHAQTPIQCCDDPQVQQLVEATVDVAEALARDRGKASSELDALYEATAAPKGLPEEERAVFAQLRSATRAASRRADPRDSLAYLTRYSLWLALRHEGGELVVAEAWCAEEGGWLQTDLDRLASPWGDCGSWR